MKRSAAFAISGTFAGVIQAVAGRGAVKSLDLYRLSADFEFNIHEFTDVLDLRFDPVLKDAIHFRGVVFKARGRNRGAQAEGY